MTRYSLCRQHIPEPPPLSDDGRAVMLAVQHRKARGFPITVMGIACECGLSPRRAGRVLDYLTAEGWLSRTAWGGICVERWLPTPVKPLREWDVTHVRHGEEPPAGAEVRREGLAHHARHIDGIAYTEVSRG